MRTDPTPETLSQAMRELRNYLASTVPDPKDAETLGFRHMILTVVDYAHHLETRLAKIEQLITPSPVIIPHENLSGYKTQERSDSASGTDVVVMLMHQSDPATNGKWVITNDPTKRLFDCAEDALAEVKR